MSLLIMSTRRINKPWGWEEIIEKNDKYVVKRLFMKEGEQCSLQYHEDKKETIIVLQGSLKIKLGQNGKSRHDKILNQQGTVTIKPCEVHRMIGVTDCIYIECSTPELDDVIRLEDNYGRA